MQLRLWTVEYRIAVHYKSRTALILAATTVSATNALEADAVFRDTKISEIIMVTEVEGPFADGHLLTRSMVEL